MSLETKRPLDDILIGFTREGFPPAFRGTV